MNWFAVMFGISAIISSILQLKEANMFAALCGLWIFADGLFDGD